MDIFDIIDQTYFSPELQIAIATDDNHSFFRSDLARNHHLTDEAQLKLFTNDANTRYAIASNKYANAPELIRLLISKESERPEFLRIVFMFSGREFSADTLKLISADPLLDLICRAKTDPEAELEMIRQAVQEDNGTWINSILRDSPLHTPEAAQLLANSKCKYMFVHENAFNKYPDIFADFSWQIPVK